jgi:hypothetical protein
MLILKFLIVFYLQPFEVTAQVNIRLTVQNTGSYDGPQNMGINMVSINNSILIYNKTKKHFKGHASINSNWYKFFERLGVNAARLFVAPITDLRKFIGTEKWGQNLNGNLVTNRIEYSLAITGLRSSNGRDINYPWKNPVKWTVIFSAINNDFEGIYGSDESVINKLNSNNISTLVVQHLGCGAAFQYKNLNPTDPIYWNERWELYKHSYAMAVWAWGKGVKMIEFYNEPDFSLGGCLTAETFKDSYFIRSSSIQNAYSDLNNANPSYKVDIKIVGAAFARAIYGGNDKKFLGDVTVDNRNYMFETGQNNTDWTNIHVYSYHTYSRLGYDMYTEYTNLANTLSPYNIPVIVTEHNVQTGAIWDRLKLTIDDADAASRLASQIMYLVLAKISSSYVFKFSITPSSLTRLEIAKNGLHWGEITEKPYHLSDTTLSAEGMRLLTKMKNSKIYPISSNDTSRLRTYVGSKNDDGRYYLYIVNDKDYDTVNLTIDFSQWNLSNGAQIIVETVATDLWGVVNDIITAGNKPTVISNPNTIIRLTIPTVEQISTTVYSDLSCTARAGLESNQPYCSSSSLFVSTSNTSLHENTSVSLVKIPVMCYVPVNQKSVLKVNIQEVIGDSDVICLVLGLSNPNVTLDESNASWDSLSSVGKGLNILMPLSSGTVIDSISKNFINWASPSNIEIVGHITAKYGIRNETRMIDVSEYVSNVIRNNGKYMTFFLYRPYRHPAYKTESGSTHADDLSNGSLIRFSSKFELTQYWQ